MWLLVLAFWRVNGGGSGSPDALLPLKSDFRLNPNDLTREGVSLRCVWVIFLRVGAVLPFIAIIGESGQLFEVR